MSSCPRESPCRSWRRVAAAALILVLPLMPASVWAQRAIPDATLQSGTLSFDAKATAGDFVGTTSTVSGALRGGPSVDSVTGWVEAPVATLVTGNGRRDRDLNKSMESKKYPTIRFDLRRARAAGQGAELDVTLDGDLTLHGVTRPVSIPAKAALSPEPMHVSGSFPLNLKDYQIGGLSKALGLFKMNEHIVVHFDLRFVPGSPP
jgi:polyisoprenoid-binding protein YceI